MDREERIQSRIAELDLKLIRLRHKRDALRSSIANLHELIRKEMLTQQVYLMPPMSELRTKYRKLYNQEKYIQVEEKQLESVEVAIIRFSKERKELTGKLEEE